MTKLIFSALFLLSVLATHAQDQVTSGPQMADSFREQGKIYVVITVIALIFLAIVGFLVYLERKIKKLEDVVNKN